MKRVISVMLVAIFLMCGSLARAQGSGFYLAPKFLMSFQNTGPMSKSWAMDGAGIDEYTQFTLGGGLAAGYDFWPQQMFPIRLEVELALRGNSEKSWWDKGRYLDHVKGVWNNTTLFANLFWDFHNESALTPFLGAGLGLAFNYSGYDFESYDGDKLSIDDRSTNFAWNAGGGVSWALNDGIALDAAYRFVGLGYNEASGYSRGRKYEVSNEPYNNEFLLGLRFSF